MPRHPLKASAAFLDFDNDGWLDLFVTHYFQWTLAENADDWCGRREKGHRIYCDPDVFKPLPNVLLRNNRDGTFTDVSDRGRPRSAPREGDGRRRRRLRRRRADGRLRHQRPGAALPVPQRRGREVLGGGLRGRRGGQRDGRHGLGHGLRLQGLRRRRLARHLPDRPDAGHLHALRQPGQGLLPRPHLPFGDRRGLGRATAAGARKFLDLDNDGGRTSSSPARTWSTTSRSTARRRSTRRAASCTATWARAGSRTCPSGSAPTSRSPAPGAGWRWPTSTTTAPWRSPSPGSTAPAALFVKKGGAAHNWILLDLAGHPSNRDGIGARVRLVLPSGRTLHEHVTTANGIYSASDKRVHFGLGSGDRHRLRRDLVAQRDRAARGEARSQPGPARSWRRRRDDGQPPPRPEPGSPGLARAPSEARRGPEEAGRVPRGGRRRGDRGPPPPAPARARRRPALRPRRDLRLAGSPPLLRGEGPVEPPRPEAAGEPPRPVGSGPFAGRGEGAAAARRGGPLRPGPPRPPAPARRTRRCASSSRPTATGFRPSTRRSCCWPRTACPTCRSPRSPRRPTGRSSSGARPT